MITTRLDYPCLWAIIDGRHVGYFNLAYNEFKRSYRDNSLTRKQRRELGRWKAEQYQIFQITKRLTR